MSEKQSKTRKKISENISSETLFTFTGKLEYQREKGYVVTLHIRNVL